MTATDDVRRLLDERGVDWSGTSFSTPAKGHPTNTSLGEEHHEATFIEYDDGNVLRLFDLTPEQAVEATLGRGECKWEPADFITEGEWWNTSCGESFTWEPYGTPNYCPNCGRAVVE